MGRGVSEEERRDYSREEEECTEEKWGQIKNERWRKLEETEADRESTVRTMRRKDKTDNRLCFRCETNSSLKINSTLKSFVPLKGLLRGFYRPICTSCML